MNELQEFELMVQRYQSQSGQKVAEAVQLAIVAKAVPERLKPHMQINCARYLKFIDLRLAIKEYVMAKTPWKLTTVIPDGLRAMEVDWIGKGRAGK